MIDYPVTITVGSRRLAHWLKLEERHQNDCETDYRPLLIHLLNLKISATDAMIKRAVNRRLRKGGAK